MAMNNALSYLNTHVTPFLEDIITELVLEMPEDPLVSIHDKIQKKMDQKHTKQRDLGVIQDLKERVQSLERKNKDLQTALRRAPSSSPGCPFCRTLSSTVENKTSASSFIKRSVSSANPTSRRICQNVQHSSSVLDDSSSTGDSEDDESIKKFEMEMQKKFSGIHRHRNSVSAEAYGEHNKVVPAEPPKHYKTEEQAKELRQFLETSSVFFFAHLTKEDREVILEAITIQPVTKGTVVIHQGDDGDVFYIVQDGEFRCDRISNGKQEFLKNYYPGESFGELALLYNTPRAATITATKDSVVLALDRVTFADIIRDQSIMQYEKFATTVKNVPLFKRIPTYKIRQICDALREETFVRGQVVISQGDQGKAMYFLKSGKCCVILSENDDTRPKKVAEFNKFGEYFGELSLVNDAPRSATVLCTSPDMQVLTLGYRAIRKILGDIADSVDSEEVMARYSENTDVQSFCTDDIGYETEEEEYASASSDL